MLYYKEVLYETCPNMTEKKEWKEQASWHELLKLKVSFVFHFSDRFIQGYEVPMLVLFTTALTGKPCFLKSFFYVFWLKDKHFILFKNAMSMCLDHRDCSKT